MKSILLSVFLGLFPLLSFSQTIRGTVRDALTKEPLAGAAIIQLQTNNGTTADEKGEFTLSLVAASLKSVEIRFVGYRTDVFSTEKATISVFLYPETVISEDAFVQATRVDTRTPMSFTNVDKDVLEQQNLGRDLPFLVQYAPSVVQTSDAGTGIGYTGIRVRGVDPTRINVTINGVPLNDPESQNVFWVNTPDLASSTSNVQIQRGVGSSTNGTAAFGATMNVETASANPERYSSVTLGGGSFGTRRFNVMSGTGTRKNLNLESRISYTESDGYVDRAEAKLGSHFLQGTYFGAKSITKAVVFGGKEITYQSWYGTPESRISGDTAAMRAFADRNYLTDRQRQNLFNSGRSYNYYDYENQVDNYQQHHVQLHHSRNLTDSLLWNLAFHYTRGKGFFEEFRENTDLSSYFIVNQQLSADVVRRRWLDNHFAGFVTGAEWRSGRIQVIGGGGFNQFWNTHFGDAYLFNSSLNFPRSRYYENDALKTDANLYAKLLADVAPCFSVFGDVQVRQIYYRFFGFNSDGTQGNQNDRLLFLNPKAGIVWNPDESMRIYASFSRGSREPGREEYISSTPESRPRAEFLNNVEAGFEKRFSRFSIQLNGYLMEYKDQLILTGEVNDVGAYIRQNVSESYRRGIEVQTSYMVNKAFTWGASATFSRNKITEYADYLDVYTNDFETLAQRKTSYSNTDISFSPNFIANNSFRFTKGKWSAEVLTKWVSRQYLDNRSDENNRLDAYTATDIVLNWRLDDKSSRRNIVVALQLVNVFDALYSSNGYSYGYVVGDETIRENYYYPQAGRHGFVQIKVGF